MQDFLQSISEMFCSVQDIKRVNVQQVWWPFIFGNKFTAAGGKRSLKQTLPCDQVHHPAGK